LRADNFLTGAVKYDMRRRDGFIVQRELQNWFGQSRRGGCKLLPLLGRDPGRPDFGGAVPILRAVFRVPPEYMAGHAFLPLFQPFELH
jgi:hypothetical protein